MATLPKNIKMVDFPADEYIAEEHPKSQIYLHHTAGRGDGVKTFKGWDADGIGRIATCVCISNGNDGGIDGEIVQGFSSKYWAWHLGAREGIFKKAGVPYKNLDKISIGIEICNAGSLDFREGKFFTWYKQVVPEDQVCTLETPHKGIRHFHKYTAKQIDSTIALVKYWSEVYNIDVTYKEEEFWQVSKKALQGVNGLYSHNSIRYDKTDVYPDPELIAALKTL